MLTTMGAGLSVQSEITHEILKNNNRLCTPLSSTVTHIHVYNTQSDIFMISIKQPQYSCSTQ